MKTIKIHSDGGSRGNPGPAGIGVVIDFDNKKHEIAEFVGHGTNNFAEYSAVIYALKWVKENIKEDSEIECFLDSQLVVEQLNGRYKLKNEGLKPLFWEIRDLVIKLGGKVSFQYIPRDQNSHADELVNIALDAHMKGPSTGLRIMEDK